MSDKDVEVRILSRVPKLLANSQSYMVGSFVVLKGKGFEVSYWKPDAFGIRRLPRLLALLRGLRRAALGNEAMPMASTNYIVI